jgi:hypothetical protein
MQTRVLILALIGVAAIGGLIVASTLDSIFAGQGSKKTECFESAGFPPMTNKDCKERV